jgi:hypothetical protein
MRGTVPGSSSYGTAWQPVSLPDIDSTTPDPVELTPANTREFLTRFGRFGDAVIRHVELNTTDPRTARVVVDAMDADNDWAWRRLTLTAIGLAEWRMVRTNAATEVVFEASISWHHGHIFISFDGPSEESADDLDAFRRSDAYLAARSCAWTADPVAA